MLCRTMVLMHIGMQLEPPHSQTMPTSCPPLSYMPNKIRSYIHAYALCCSACSCSACVSIPHVWSGWMGRTSLPSMPLTLPHHCVVCYVSRLCLQVHPIKGSKLIKVHFNVNRSELLPWAFTPQQIYVTVLLGEISLAFYKAKMQRHSWCDQYHNYNLTLDQVSSSSYQNQAWWTPHKLSER